MEWVQIFTAKRKNVGNFSKPVHAQRNILPLSLAALAVLKALLMTSPLLFISRGNGSRQEDEGGCPLPALLSVGLMCWVDPILGGGGQAWGDHGRGGFSEWCSYKWDEIWQPSQWFENSFLLTQRLNYEVFFSIWSIEKTHLYQTDINFKVHIWSMHAELLNRDIFAVLAFKKSSGQLNARKCKVSSPVLSPTSPECATLLAESTLHSMGLPGTGEVSIYLPIGCLVPSVSSQTYTSMPRSEETLQMGPGQEERDRILHV